MTDAEAIRRSRSTRTLALMLCSVILAGCVSMAPPMKPAASVDAGAGYVYGRFTVGAPLDQYARSAAFVLEEVRTGKQYRIEFSGNRAPAAVGVSPGRYSIRQLDIVSGGNLRSGSTDLSRSLLAVPFVVEAGRAYYLGDYRVATRFDIDTSDLFFTKYATEWQIVALHDEFEITTEDVRRMLPALARVPASKAIEGLPPAERWWAEPLPEPARPQP
jgi:hypothetical protein